MWYMYAPVREKLSPFLVPFKDVVYMCCQVLGIKLLVKWLLGLTSDYEKSSNPVLRLLTTVLAHDGDLQGDDNVRSAFNHNI